MDFLLIITVSVSEGWGKILRDLGKYIVTTHAPLLFKLERSLLLKINKRLVQTFSLSLSLLFVLLE